MQWTNRKCSITDTMNHADSGTSVFMTFGPSLNGKTPKQVNSCHSGGSCCESMFERQPECSSVLYKQSPSRSKCCLCGNNSDSTDPNNGATCFCIACSVTNWHQTLLIMVWNVYLRNSDTNTDKFLQKAFHTEESERKEKLLLGLAGGIEINGSGIRVSAGTKGEHPVSWSN